MKADSLMLNICNIDLKKIIGEFTVLLVNSITDRRTLSAKSYSLDLVNCIWHYSTLKALSPSKGEALARLFLSPSVARVDVNLSTFQLCD